MAQGTQEFAYDLTLTGTIRVKAVSGDAARKAAREFIHNCEIRATTDNIEFSLGDIEGEMDLVEINGEAV